VKIFRIEKKGEGGKPLRPFHALFNS
jgi:hypothetical protein